MSNTPIRYGGDIKSLGDGVVGGYLVRFTDGNERDLYGEYFDAKTEFYLNDHPIIGKPVLYNHGMDDAVGVKSFGTFTKMSIDERGLWVEAQLKELDDYVQMLNEIDNRAHRKYGRGLGWSSGALPQSVTADDNGHIKTWAIIEGSLTLRPADPNNQATIKSINDLRSLLREVPPIEATNEPQDNNLSTETKQGVTRMDEAAVQGIVNEFIAKLLGFVLGDNAPTPGDGSEAADEETMMMDDAEQEEFARSIAGKVKDMLEADTGYQDATDKEKAAARVLKARETDLLREVAETVYREQESRKAERAKVLADAKAAAAKAAPGVSKTEPAGGYRGQSPTVRNVRDLEFDHLSAEDMMLGYLVMSAQESPAARRNMKNVASERYIKAMGSKFADFVETHDFRDRRDVHAIRQVFPWRTDDINATDISGQGQDWVETSLGTTLWERARETQVYDALASKGMMQVEIPRGSNSVNIPTEGADPIAYSAPQANDLDAVGRVETTANPGFIGTGTVTLTPGKIMIAAAITGEMQEDSIIPAIPQATSQINMKAQETMTQLLLNGDTVITGSTNLNLIDGTPGTGVDRPYYLASDGILKYPIITATSYARSAAGGLSFNDYLATLKLLPSNVRTRKQQLCWISDADTSTASLGLPEIATDDVRRTNATITSGMLTNILGIDFLETGFIPLANNAGKVPNGGGTLGRLALVYAPYWAVGFIRRVTVELQRDALSDVTYVVASMRLGFQERGAGAAAASYNIGV